MLVHPHGPCNFIFWEFGKFRSQNDLLSFCPLEMSIWVDFIVTYFIDIVDGAKDKEKPLKKSIHSRNKMGHLNYTFYYQILIEKNYGYIIF